MKGAKKAEKTQAHVHFYLNDQVSSLLSQQGDLEVETALKSLIRIEQVGTFRTGQRTPRSMLISSGSVDSPKLYNRRSYMHLLKIEELC